MNATVFFQWIGSLPPILQAVAVVIAFAVVVAIILLLVDIAPRRGTQYTIIRLAMCLLIPLAVMWFFNSYYWAMGVAVAVGALFFWLDYRSRDGAGYLIQLVAFMAPAMLLLLVGLILPSIQTMYTSFWNSSGNTFVGFANYVWIFTQSDGITSVVNTIIWVLLVPTVSTIVGLAYAVFIDRTRGEKIYKVLVFMPMAISFVGASIIWRFMYEYRGPEFEQIGLLNQILVWFGGTPQQWLLNQPWNNLFLIVVLIWVQTGFAMVVLSASIKGVPAELLEAAELDGAYTVHAGRRVAEHLFSVASGLESVVSGEGEIAGQVRRALKSARKDGTTSPELERLFQRASQAQRKVKNVTALGRAGRSLVRLALELADSRIADWSAERVLLVGTGAYAAVTLATLRERGAVDISVYSPSGRAEIFAAKHGIRAVAAADYARTAAHSSLLITCTSATEPVLGPEHLQLPVGLAAAGCPVGSHSQLVVDLGMPRNVDPAVATLEGVALLDLETIRLHAPLEELQATDAARTVVREALLLLEEDRLVRTRRGVGRFVADAVPAIGWERLRPIEQVLGESGGAAEVSRVSEGEQQASGFVAAAFGVEEEAPVWARESVLRRSGRPVCVSFECVPGDSALAAEIRGRGSSASGTLLGEFLSSAGRSVVASRCELTAGAAGAQRAAQLGDDEHAPVLVITQFVSLAGSPAYLAKHVLSPDAGAAELVQTY
ncbi:MAG: glutamyl-tRNA reductase, partial [Microbacterium sp.]|nr:glutamyl-tRNA reductase [Microbacterium sp.]